MTWRPISATGSSAIFSAAAHAQRAADYYRWKKEYGGLKIDQVKRLKGLERENSRLERAVVTLAYENSILTLKEAEKSARWKEWSEIVLSEHAERVAKRP